MHVRNSLTEYAQPAWAFVKRIHIVAAGLAVCLMASMPSAYGQGATESQFADSLWGPAGEAPPGVVDKANRLVSEIVEPEVVLDLDPQRSKLLRTTKPVSRMSITDPSVVETVQYSPTEFELIGGSTGQTVVTFWFGEEGQDQEILRYIVRVEPNKKEEDRRRVEVGELERRINEFFHNSSIQLVPIADKVIVKGQARSVEEAAEIMAVLQRDEGAQQTTGIFAGQIAEAFPGGGGISGGNLVNMIDIPGEKQVMLKVRVAELTRSALRQMGSELDLNFGDFAFESALGIAGAARAILDTTDVDLALDFLATNSYSKILAEPNLVTLSGQPANFISGGEFPVPTVVGVEGVGAVSTNFRGFGTQVSFTPTVLDKDRIRMVVTPTVSAINQDNAVDGIPGLDTRSVETTVDLREGQWLAIAGLIQDSQNGSKARVPFVGDIPYLDMFFSKRSVKREETELLILVSPELVHPLEPEEAPLILPGMEVTEPTDWGFFLSGRYEGRDNCEFRSTYWPKLQRQWLDARQEAKVSAHFQATEAYYIQGDYGFSQ